MGPRLFELLERRRRRRAVVALAVSLFAAFFVGLGQPGTADASDAQGTAPTALVDGWQVVSVPTPPGSHSSLAAVSGGSARDVWAVGESLSKSGSRLRTLTEHFDGRRWTVVRSPNLGGTSSLSGVAELSAHDVWAVGAGSSTLGNVPMLLHWDGIAWRLVAGAVSSAGELRAVSGSSSWDIWVVGSATVGSSEQTLIEHFDGTKWTMVPSPTPDGADQIVRGGSSHSHGRMDGRQLSIQHSGVAHAPRALERQGVDCSSGER